MRVLLRAANGPHARRPPPRRWEMVRRILIGRRPRQTLIRTLILAVVCYAVFRFAFLPVYVKGDSMAPTYRDASLNMANTLVYRFREPTPGEVVVIEMAGRRTMFLKRVLAGPGDVVYFEDGLLMVNGRSVDEPYVMKHGTWTTEPENLEPDEYFVAGDNRAMPWEWHTMGVVHRSRIAGRVVF